MRSHASQMRSRFTLSVLTAAISSALQAQPSTNQVIEEVVVRAHPLSAEGLAQPVAVLNGIKLQRVLSTSLGETLRNVPGVNSASFGQAVGRPVIRGLGGPRVKVMEDRIDSLDVSVSSPDHMTMVEPFTADSIEVLKGPSTLLYGSGAIGGVVDVHTGRIPHEVPENLSGSFQMRDADNANQTTASGRLDGGTGNFAFHLDAFYRDADEYEIPGFAESSAMRALEEQERHNEHDDHGGDAEAFGILPNSQLEAAGGALGASFIGERSFIGFSLSNYDAKYGLSGHSHSHHDDHGDGHDDDHIDGYDDHHDAHGDEEGGAVLDLAQTRFDLEAGMESPLAGIQALNFRLGYNDYEHVEFEGSGEAGTVFATEALESRFEFTHDALGFEGASGIQISSRQFSAIGEEAFVQPVDTQTFGLFYVGQRRFGELGLEAGVRRLAERVDQLEDARVRP